MQIDFPYARHLHPIGVILLSLLCNLAHGASADSAALLGPQPDIEVYVDTPEGIPVYRMRAANAMERIFGATIEFPGNASLGDGDVYFGLRQPAGAVFTWTAGKGEPLLERGMTPLVKGIDLGAEYVFGFSEVFGEDIRYAFTGSEPRGIYMVFALLVVAGTSPSDTRNWIGVDMAPLLID